MFIGMEYFKSNQLATASTMMETAVLQHKTDPVLWNEIGVLNYQDEK
jgi:hypothetical protein